MILAAFIAFVLSLFGIVALFALKYREVERGEVFAPAIRELGDAHALDFKAFLARCRAESSLWLPRALLFLRTAVHRGALSFASFARVLERRAHELADLVSHKHGFERRQTRSEFLRQMSEYRNGAHDAADVR